MKKTLILLALIFSVLLLSALYILYALNRPNYSNETSEKIVEVSQGMGVSEIASLLKKETLINSEALFILWVKLSKTNLQAGTYKLPTNLNIKQMVEKLSFGTFDSTLTLIEGLRAEEIAELAATKFENVVYEDFMKLVVEQRLEGKLFPDTYFVQRDLDTLSLIGLLTENFSNKAEPLLKKNKTQLTTNEVLILASIVEREEPNDAERSTVAGILVDRFKNGEALGADATVQYMVGKSLDWWPKQISEADLSSEHPFNTRKIVGLPPHPICNPGISSIKAVLENRSTNYNYYLHDSEGKVHYAVTLEEHNENISKYLPQ